MGCFWFGTFASAGHGLERQQDSRRSACSSFYPSCRAMRLGEAVDVEQLTLRNFGNRGFLHLGM